LQAAFRSWRRACLAFLALPVGLVGGELAGLAGGAFSLGALFGLLAVLALAARHAVALFARYRRLEAHDGERFGPALVLHGAGDRLAPILTTALATAVALLPFVVLGDRPGYELVQPMAVVILGGLVTSTLMVLFVLPVLYLSFGETRRPAVDYEAAIVRQWAGAEAEPAATQGNGPQAAGHEAEKEGEPDAR